MLKIIAGHTNESCSLVLICLQDFEIDKSSQEYRSLHPISSQKHPSLVEEHFEPVIENEDESVSDSDASATSQSPEDEPGHEKSKRAKKERGPR